MAQPALGRVYREGGVGGGYRNWHRLDWFGHGLWDRLAAGFAAFSITEFGCIEAERSR